jgi:hypothetical protein
VLRYPPQAKTRLEWGTRPLLPVEQAERRACIRVSEYSAPPPSRMLHDAKLRLSLRKGAWSVSTPQASTVNRSNGAPNVIPSTSIGVRPESQAIFLDLSLPARKRNEPVPQKAGSLRLASG